MSSTAAARDAVSASVGASEMHSNEIGHGANPDDATKDNADRDDDDNEDNNDDNDEDALVEDVQVDEVCSCTRSAVRISNTMLNSQPSTQ